MRRKRPEPRATPYIIARRYSYFAQAAKDGVALPEAMRPVPEAALGAVSETLREQGLPAPSTAGGMGASADAKGVTYLQARTANEVLKAQERRIRLQKLKGELVDRARATAVVFRLARQERDSWAGWPARIAAMMAADLGISAHRMQTVLEAHVRQHLGRVGGCSAGPPLTRGANFWTPVQRFRCHSTAPTSCFAPGARA